MKLQQRKRSRHNPYPWDQWLKKHQLRLHKSIDYFCAPHSMAVQVRTAAYKRRISVSVLIEGTTLIITRK